VLATIAVLALAAVGAWTWTRDPGKHHTLPDLCTGVTAGTPGSCTWSANGTEFTAQTTLFDRTSMSSAPARAASKFDNDREAARNRVADSGYPKAFREIPGVADEAFCVEQYDGSAYSVACTARADNALLKFTADWNDPTGQPGMRDAVATALTAYTPTAQHELNNLIARL
jgi:hypothetical protein